MADSGNDFLAGMQVGGSIMGQSLDRNLRYQQLKSQDAVRMAQERASAQHMSMILEDRQKQIQYSADMEKAMSAAQLAASPVAIVPEDLGGGVMPNTSRIPMTDALAKFVAPVVAKYDPSKVGPFMQTLAMDEYRKAEADRQKKLSETESAFKPGFTTQADPRTGKEYTVFQGSKNASQIVSGDMGITTLTDDQGNPHAILDPGKGTPRVLTDAGSRQDKSYQLKDRFEQTKLVEKFNPSALYQDENGQTQIRQGGYEKAVQIAQAAPSPAVKSEIEKQLLAADKVGLAANEFAGALTSNNVGPSGALKSAGEKVGSIFGAKLGAGSATETRAKAARFREELAALASSQGLSAGTKQRIQLVLHDVPDAESLITGGPVLQNQLSQILTTVANETQVNARTIGKPISTQWMNPDDITAQYAAGKITKDQARQFLGSNMLVLAKKLKDNSEK